MSISTYLRKFIVGSKREYPIKIIGEKLSEGNKETLIIYRITPKKEIFEIPLKNLLADATLVEKIHPYQAVKLGFMSCGEIMFNYKDEKDQKRKYQEIVKKMHG